MAARYAVTGASGFLGGNLVRALRGDGHEVLAVVRTRRTTDADGARTLDDVFATPSVLDGVDVIVHAAAIRHRYGTSRDDYLRANVGSTERLLAIAKGRVKRFVFVSSVGVHGFPKALPVTEAAPYAPCTLYSQSKVEAERAVRTAQEKGDFYTVIIRPTIFYGTGDRNGMLDKMARMITAGTYAIVGDGENVLHHTHVDDIVAGTRLACERPEAVGEDFILCGPETTTLRRLSELTARALGRRLPPIHVPIGFARVVASAFDFALPRLPASLRLEPPLSNEKIDVMTIPVAFDCGKARRMLGYAPVVTYDEGIRRTVGEYFHHKADR